MFGTRRVAIADVCCLLRLSKGKIDAQKKEGVTPPEIEIIAGFWREIFGFPMDNNGVTVNIAYGDNGDSPAYVEVDVPPDVRTAFIELLGPDIVWF